MSLLPVLFLVAACSANPATGEQSFTAFMSEEKELRLGAEEHPKIIKQSGGVFSPDKWSPYVREIGRKLASFSERPNLPWTFTVLNDTQVNAFALPGGYVYITRGLLALASDEAEMAGVLSHEIGHIAARHSAQRYSSTVASNLGLQVLGVLTNAAGVGGLENLAAVGAEIGLKSYSREQELESDLLAVRYMTRAGYAPQAMASFFEKLRVDQRIQGRLAGDPERAEKTDIMATHPRTAERIRQAIKLADGTTNRDGRRGAKTYLDMVDDMVFGDGADQGLVRGQVFTHPTLRFQFEVPEGFTLRNLPTQVVATDKNKNTIVFSAAALDDLQKAGGMERYLTNMWSGQLALKNVEWIDINAMKAVTGVASVRVKGRRFDVRRLVVEQTKDHYWRFEFITRPQDSGRINKALRRTTYSFRTLSQSQANAVQPWRVRVVDVGNAVTYDDLVGAMVMEDNKADWFEALNGIGPDTPLLPGMRVKIVK